MSNLIPFNLTDFASKEKVDPLKLRAWLVSKEFECRLDRSVLYNKTKHESLIAYAMLGIAVDFSTSIKEQIRKVEKKLDALEKTVTSHETSIQTLQIQIIKLNEEGKLRQQSMIDLQTIESDLKRIRTQYEKSKALAALKLNSHYQEKIREKKRLITSNASLFGPEEIISKIKKINESIGGYRSKIEFLKPSLSILSKQLLLLEQERNKRIIREKAQVQANLPGTKDNKNIQPGPGAKVEARTKEFIPAPPLFEYSVQWQDVHFFDGYVVLKLGSRCFDRFTVTESRKSFNYIKTIYKFRSAPPLVITVVGNAIKEIKNAEVLFYFLNFFSFANTFDKKLIKNTAFSYIHFKSFSKNFYNKNFPEIFLPRCFSFLCERAIEDLPIIPVPEIVINGNNTTQMHDSFLFPLKNSNTITWVWESIEESKASYVFKVPENQMESSLQRIYDYLTGGTVNKRLTLIQNPKVAIYLGLYRRIMHTDEHDWRTEVKCL